MTKAFLRPLSNANSQRLIHFSDPGIGHQTNTVGNYVIMRTKNPWHFEVQFLHFALRKSYKHLVGN